MLSCVRLSLYLLCLEIRDQHENLEGKHSPSDPPIQSSTPFASRPINPTPAQAAGRPTPTTTRPTNPTPRQASNLINNEGTGIYLSTQRRSQALSSGKEPGNEVVV